MIATSTVKPAVRFGNSGHGHVPAAPVWPIPKSFQNRESSRQESSEFLNSREGQLVVPKRSER
eukprot:9228307-Alexandrium_andersonii.AAC.1